MENQPRELTTEEVRERFLTKVRDLVKYRVNIRNEPEQDGFAWRVSGVAFSILAELDGCGMNLPAFIVAPYLHPSDKEDHLNNNENWFPENHEANINCDIAGSLHELFYQNAPKPLP